MKPLMGLFLLVLISWAVAFALGAVGAVVVDAFCMVERQEIC